MESQRNFHWRATGLSSHPKDPVPSWQDHFSFFQSSKNAGLTLLTFSPISACCHYCHFSEASLCPAFPPRLPPDLQLKHRRGLKGTLEWGRGVGREGGRETFRRSNHLGALMKGSFRPATKPGSLCPLGHGGGAEGGPGCSHMLASLAQAQMAIFSLW